jgi:hypothetical protein
MEEIPQKCLALVGEIVTLYPALPKDPPTPQSSEKERGVFSIISDVQQKLATLVFWIKEFQRGKIEVEFLKDMALATALSVRIKLNVADRYKLPLTQIDKKNIASLCDKCYDLAALIEPVPPVTRDECESGLHFEMSLKSEKYGYCSNIASTAIGSIVGKNFMSEDVWLKVCNGVVETRKQLDQHCKPSQDEIWFKDGNINDEFWEKVGQIYKEK